jgi:hypothetical protein
MQFSPLWHITNNQADDNMMPTINSFVLQQNIPHAFLIIYLDSGHGFLFQYATLFAEQVNSFFDGWKNKMSSRETIVLSLGTMLADLILSQRQNMETNFSLIDQSSSLSVV